MQYIRVETSWYIFHYTLDDVNKAAYRTVTPKSGKIRMEQWKPYSYVSITRWIKTNSYVKLASLPKELPTNPYIKELSKGMKLANLL